MRSYLRTLCALALMLGTVGMGRAMAATTDNLQMEVHVTIVGTHDVVWTAASGSVVTLAGPVLPGTNENVLVPANNNVDSVAALAGGSAGTGANDLVRWEINTPLLGQIRGTQAGGSDAAVDFFLNNVGNKKVNISALIPDATAADSVAGPNTWALGAAPGTSTFQLEIQATDSGANAAPDPLSAIPVADLLQTSYTSFAVGAAVPLVQNYKRFSNHLSIDLRYSTPTDVNLNSEFDVDHVTTITIATTAP